MVKSLTGMCACACMYVHTLQVGICGELSRKWQDIPIQRCLPYTSDSQTSLTSGFILLSKCLCVPLETSVQMGMFVNISCVRSYRRISKTSIHLKQQ